MDNSIECNTGEWIYSGEKFKNFLQRRNISYKEASENLGIDKNTVGKAVRGGNLNIDIILRICNIYGLCIYDFFKHIDSENREDDTNYYFSPNKELNSISHSAEPQLNYKKSKNSIVQIETLSEYLFQIKSIMNELDEKIEKSNTMLQEMRDNNE